MAKEHVDVERVITLVDRIRDYVNQPRVHSTLYADKQSYNRACSAMDMIGDTTQALRSYFELADPDTDIGTSYLVVFGALQILYVQQDAVFWLCKTLGFPNATATLRGPDKWVYAPGNERLGEVRTLRNSTVGHPVNRDKGSDTERGSYFIVQMSLSPFGCQLLAATADGNHRWIDVDIPKLVQAQVDGVEALLTRALQEIEDAEKAHRERFKGQRLEHIFASLAHPVEKLHEGVGDETFRPVGMYGVRVVQKAMQRFRNELTDRAEPFGDDLDYLYRQIDAALSRLADFYESRVDDRELADILAVFVADRIDELRRWARSKDTDYDPVEDDVDTPRTVTVSVTDRT